MARRPGNADRRMLQIGKKIVSQQGVSALRVRKVAQAARVNLGMFHYHFKSKERFKRILLQEVYENFFEKMLVASNEGNDSISQLRNLLLAMGYFVRDEREFYLAAFRDVLNNDAAVIRFIRENFPRHASVVADLIRNCQKEGTMVQLPFPQIMSFIMTSLNIPTLISHAVQKHSDKSEKSFFNFALGDEAIAWRIDTALKGLRP